MDQETISVDRLERGTTFTAEQYDLFVSYLNTGVKPSVTSLRNAGMVLQPPRGANDCVSDKSKLKANRSRNYDRFNSIGRRLSLRPTDGALLFKSTKRIILPETQFEDVIRKAHASSTKHLNISQTIQKLSRTYSMGWRQFGISEELVRDVVRQCKECKNKTTRTDNRSCSKQTSFSTDDGTSTKKKSASQIKKSPRKMVKKPDVPLVTESAILRELHKPIAPAIQPPPLPVIGSLLPPLWTPAIRTPKPFIQQIPVAIQPLTSGDYAVKPYFHLNNYSTLQLQPRQMFSPNSLLNTGAIGVGNLGNSLIFGKQLIRGINGSACRLTWVPTIATSQQARVKPQTAALTTAVAGIGQSPSEIENASVLESQPRPTNFHDKKVLSETSNVIVVDNLIDHEMQDSFNDHALISSNGLGRYIPSKTEPEMYDSSNVVNVNNDTANISIASKPVLDLFSEEELSDIAMGTGWPDVTVGGDDAGRIREEPMDVEDSSSTDSTQSIDTDTKPNHYVPFKHVWHRLDDLENETNPYQRINIGISDMRPELLRSLTEDRRALDWLKKKLDYVTYMVRQQKTLSQSYLPLADDFP